MIGRALPLALALTACASGPRVGTSTVVRQPVAAESPDEAFGAQVEVTDGDTRHFGEALACDDERLYLLVNTQASNAYESLRWRDVNRLRLPQGGYGGGFAAWTTLGALSSFSHGFYALLTLPAWLAAGIPSSIIAGDVATTVNGCREVAAYTRFPQGMPAPFRDAHFATRPRRPTPPALIAPPALVAPWATR